MFADSTRNRLAARLFALAFAAGIAVEIGVLGFKYVADPSFVLLMPSEGARWIREPRPMDIALITEGPETAFFEKHFVVVNAPDRAVLRFRALERATISLDGEPIFVDKVPQDDWKDWREVDLAPRLGTGSHALRIAVTRQNGRPLLQARCAPLTLFTGTDWRASPDSATWAPSAIAADIAPLPESRAFPSTPESLLRGLPVLLPLFLVGALARWGIARGRLRLEGVEKWGLLVLRGVLIVSLAVLGINNLYRVPAWFGFDVVGHMEYIHYIAQFGRIPLAPDGWKMHEAPLYHLVASIPYRFIYHGLTAEQNTIAMRVIPMICGLLQIEIGYRTIRLGFPGRLGAQAVGTALCALLPMNIYLSQFPSNQPFVGVLSALAVYFSVRLLTVPAPGRRYDELLLLGLTLGLAVLSKITALLVAPGALIAAAFWTTGSGGQRGRWRGGLAAPAIVLAILCIVSGWYFVRNQLVIGSPFSVGYSESLGTVWRQDPGFRAPAHFMRFGEGLLHPVHAAFVGYWDSLYSTFWSDGLISSGQVPDGYTYGDPRPPSVPPWNFVMLGAATLLSLAPLSLILLGSVRALARPGDAVARGTLLSLFLIGTHLAGMMYLYLSLPMVSAGKAAYLLNVLPCFGLLAAQGFVILERRPVLSAFAVGGICAWGGASYLAFFAN